MTPSRHCERSVAIHAVGLRGCREWRAAHADKEAWIATSLTLLAMTGLRDFDGFRPSLRAQRGNPFVPCMRCMPFKVDSI
jgi:hypothetical protein